MGIPRIYHPHRLRPGSHVVLTGDAANHLGRVLRLKPGAEIRLFDGSGDDYVAYLERPGREGLRVRIGEPERRETESPLRVTLLQGICRRQKMDLVVQKATELGVAEIRPVLCERSVVQLSGERAERRRAHWQGVARGAAEQCGRAVLPEVFPAADLAAAVTGLPADGLRLMLDPDAGQALGSVLPAPRELALLVGPEGGLSPAERDLSTAAGFLPVRLGPRTLRTETAPLAALSVLQYLYGDLGAG